MVAANTACPTLAIRIALRGALVPQVAPYHERNGQSDTEDQNDRRDGGRPWLKRRARNVAERQHDEIHDEPDDDAVDDSGQDEVAAERAKGTECHQEHERPDERDHVVKRKSQQRRCTTSVKGVRTEYTARDALQESH